MSVIDCNLQIAEILERWTKEGKQVVAAEANTGAPQGWVIFLYENGDKMFQGAWQNGVPHGRTQTWYLSGEPMHDVQFEHGYLHGNWHMWSESGELLISAFYEFGMKLEWIEWDQNGQIKQEWRATRS